MPDGSGFDLHRRTAPQPVPPPAHQAQHWGLAAGLAIVLHVAAVLPLVLLFEHDVAPATVEGVEVAPAMDAAAPDTTDQENVAEAVTSASAQPVETSTPVPPEPVQASEVTPEHVQAPRPDRVEPVTPPDRVEMARPEQVERATPPERVVEATPPPPEPVEPPPPEQMQAEAPPHDAVPSDEPELLSAAIEEETVTAALPPPPPAPPPPTPPPPTPPQARPRPTPVPRARIAPAAPAVQTAAPTAAAAAAPIQAPVQRRPSPSYIGVLLAALERHKDYPMAARLRRIEGVALLRFAMRRDGSVASWRLDRSTGDADLDEAVGQMVRRASPLPPPPNELPGDPIELVVPVRFALR